MVREDTGHVINGLGVPVGWVELSVVGVNGSPAHNITVRAGHINGVHRSGPGSIVWVGLKPWGVAENYEEVFRRIAGADKPEVKEPMLMTPAVQPANGVSDGTVPVRKKAK